MKRTMLTLVGLSLALLAASCSKDSGPTAGEFNVSLTTPNSDDGAIQFTATASTPATITSLGTACTGCKLFVVRVSDNLYRGVLTGQLAAGTLFHIGVSDTKIASSYSVTIDAVSTRAHAVRGSALGYSIKLVP